MKFPAFSDALRTIQDWSIKLQKWRADYDLFTKGFGFGIYTPVVVNVTNVSASTAGDVMWMRIGNHVIGAGSVTFDPVVAGYSAITITLPIVASNFTGTQQVSGTCNGEKGGATVGSLVVSSVNGANTARISGYTTYTDNTDHRFIFQYQIIKTA